VQTKVPLNVIFMSKYRYQELTGTLPFYMKKTNLYIGWCWRSGGPVPPAQ
jgi:hypothetical protein